MTSPLKWQTTVPYGMEPVVAVARTIVGNATSVVLVEPTPATEADDAAKAPDSSDAALLSWAILLADIPRASRG